MREVFPAADGLHEIAQVIVSTTADKIRVRSAAGDERLNADMVSAVWRPSSGPAKSISGLSAWTKEAISPALDGLCWSRLVPFHACQYTISAMELARAVESLQAAELCLREALVNSAASRAYYAMFQAAQVALEAGGLVRSEWSHRGVQASFNQELIQRRKLYPRGSATISLPRSRSGKRQITESQGLAPRSPGGKCSGR